MTSSKLLRVLVACEYSGSVRDAFTAAGHYALSCDLLPTESPGPHHQGDIFDVLDDGWDLMVAHPPCTYMANSGAKHLYQLNGNRTVKDAADKPIPNPARWEAMREGAAFFRRLLEADIPKVAVENPVMMGHAMALLGDDGKPVKPTQVIQPWWFGHPEKKATGLWLRGLPPLTPTDDVSGVMATLPLAQTQRIWRMAPGPDRQKERARFFPGVAAAMADQWGGLA